MTEEKKVKEKKEVRAKPARRGANYKQGAGKERKTKRDGLKGIHFDRWLCSDVTCNHEQIDAFGTLVCSEFAAYAENSNEGTEVRLEVFRTGVGVWEASVRMEMHPNELFKTSHAAKKFVETKVREAFAQLTRNDL